MRALERACAACGNCRSLKVDKHDNLADRSIQFTFTCGQEVQKLGDLLHCPDGFSAIFDGVKMTPVMTPKTVPLNVATSPMKEVFKSEIFGRSAIDSILNDIGGLSKDAFEREYLGDFGNRAAAIAPQKNDNRDHPKTSSGSAW